MALNPIIIFASTKTSPRGGFLKIVSDTKRIFCGSGRIIALENNNPNKVDGIRKFGITIIS